MLTGNAAQKVSVLSREEDRRQQPPKKGNPNSNSTALSVQMLASESTMFMMRGLLQIWNFEHKYEAVINIRDFILFDILKIISILGIVDVWWLFDDGGLTVWLSLFTKNVKSWIIPELNSFIIW